MARSMGGAGPGGLRQPHPAPRGTSALSCEANAKADALSLSHTPKQFRDFRSSFIVRWVCESMSSLHCGCACGLPLSSWHSTVKTTGTGGVRISGLSARESEDIRGSTSLFRQSGAEHSSCFKIRLAAYCVCICARASRVHNSRATVGSFEEHWGSACIPIRGDSHCQGLVT